MDPQNKQKIIIAGAAFVALVVAIFFLFIFHRAPKGPKTEEAAGEVKQLSEIDVAKRPYVTLTPTTDGAEIIISMENMGAFDKIEYELTYQADNPQSPGDKIQRGSTGTDINTKEPKYKKSLLLGTASRGVRSPDKGIADGKFTLHAFKGNTEFQNETDWNLIQAGARKATIADKAGNLSLDIAALGKDHWIIVGDTIGFPTSDAFDPKKAILPSVGAFSVDVAGASKAPLTWKLQGDVKDADLYSFKSEEGKWQKEDAKFDAGTKTITAAVFPFATFVAVSK